MKSGWKTTEFWATAVMILAVLAGWIAGRLPADTALIVSAISAGLYATSRGLAKAGAGDAELRTRLAGLLAGDGDDDADGNGGAGDGLHIRPPGTNGVGH